MEVDKKNLISKFIKPLVVVVLILIGYFVYSTMFKVDENSLNSASNAYVSQTKVGKYNDLINKENMSFNTNINSDNLKSIKDFSVVISKSSSQGRTNPFLP